MKNTVEMGGVEPPSEKARYITDVIARNSMSLARAAQGVTYRPCADADDRLEIKSHRESSHLFARLVVPDV